jgi:uridine kinase
MIISRPAFYDISDIRLFINECETKFESELSQAASDSASFGTRIITLSGPTCSGKTTAAEKLVGVLSSAGKQVHVISIDDYFYNRDYLDSISPDGKIDFDSPKTIDLAMLEKTVVEIDKAKTVHIPHFDFVLGRRSRVDEFSPSPDAVYIFEGIQAIYPDVTSLLSHHNCKSVFISVAEELRINDTVFDRRDLRFFRRLVRDCRVRNSTPEFTFTLWESVCENEDINILPYASNADIKINSLLGYEPYVIKPYLIPLLETISCESRFHSRSREIIKAFENIEPIDEKFIPKNSLFREFIG